MKIEFANLTSETLCFPVPAQSCTEPELGSVITEGKPFNDSERDYFICHVDGGGRVGVELDSQISNRWIKIAPNGIYVTDPADAIVKLDETGDWILTASYYPPQGSFSANYKKILRDAATKAGCRLPVPTAVAEPERINVHSDK